MVQLIIVLMISGTWVTSACGNIIMSVLGVQKLQFRYICLVSTKILIPYFDDEATGKVKQCNNSAPVELPI